MNKDWNIFSYTRAGKHTSGLVVYAASTVDDEEYMLKYYNLDQYKGNDVEKAELSKEFIKLMKEKYKDNAHYIIPIKTKEELYVIGRNNIGKEL